ncbi:MAG: glycosyltransferase family 4 protein [Acidobacteriia bacterium]|nr:glycosyltransferase family 4 protein [Terriglobia bacterium]
MSLLGPEIHLLNPLWDAAGGSEWRTIELFRELRERCNVTLWSEHAIDPQFAAEYPIRRISTFRSQFPQTGTLVVVGVYFKIGRWYRRTNFHRVIVVYNTFLRKQLQKKIKQLSMDGKHNVELVYASKWLQGATGLPGLTQQSLIDLSRFTPMERTLAGQRLGRFIVGRLSRDVPEKHHGRDPELYRSLVSAGCEVKVMGGTCLRPHLKKASNIELLPAQSMDASHFLRNLDCFYYRTSDRLLEGAGRVVAEAMACGLPVVCHRLGGYREMIEHERTGFLFDTDEEAFQTIVRLKQDQNLRETVGQAARRSMESLYSLSERQKIINYYINGPRQLN